MAEVDYDELRKKNIANRKAKFADFFKELKAETSDLKEQLVRKKKITNYSSDEDTENRPPRKKRRWQPNNYSLEFTRTYNTRSRSRRTSENGVDSDNADRKINKPKSKDKTNERLVPLGRSLKVIFPWAKTFEREMEMTRIDKWDVDKELAEDTNYTSEEEYDSENGARNSRSGVFKVSKSIYDPNSIPSVDEITDDMLNNLAEKSTGKIYCKLNGTSCHQCRQKTMDTKTVCRSGECIGVRGQFCASCLRGRYGEDAAAVLKDPNWSCPPCRGLCNCSICRTKNGQRPTGILAPVAQEEGFTSVMDYLRATSEDEEEAVESSN